MQLILTIFTIFTCTHIPRRCPFKKEYCGGSTTLITAGLMLMLDITSNEVVRSPLSKCISFEHKISNTHMKCTLHKNAKYICYRLTRKYYIVCFWSDWTGLWGLRGTNTLHAYEFFNIPWAETYTEGVQLLGLCLGEKKLAVQSIK